MEEERKRSGGRRGGRGGGQGDGRSDRQQVNNVNRQLADTFEASDDY